MKHLPCDLGISSRKLRQHKPVDPLDIKANGGLDSGTRHALQVILSNGAVATNTMSEKEVGLYYIKQLDILTERLRRLVREQQGN